MYVYTYITSQSDPTNTSAAKLSRVDHRTLSTLSVVYIVGQCSLHCRFVLTTGLTTGRRDTVHNPVNVHAGVWLVCTECLALIQSG